MEVTNAFIGQASAPSEKEIAAALGPSAPAWSELLQWAAEHGATTQEWKSFSAKYGWSLRLKRKDRNIVHLAPCNGCFHVALIFGDRAMESVRKATFSAPVRRLIAEAPHYPEGTGIRLMVRGPRDLAPIRKLAAIKLAH